jgi:quinol monooxygenase YgiN
VPFRVSLLERVPGASNAGMFGQKDEQSMYARITSFRVDPARLHELPAKIQKIQPAARALAGVVDIYLAWRGDGHGTITAIYHSKAEADAAVGRMQAIWGAVADLLMAAPRTDIYDNVEHIAG